MIETWKVLDSRNQLDKAIADSHIKTVVLFKHSVTCGISARSKYMLEEEWNFSEGDFDFYYLDLLSYRSVSNDIASLLGVQHQSPQVIVVKNGKAVYDMSHHRISIPALYSALEANS